MVSALELFPTAIAAAGAKSPAALDGVDLLPHLGRTNGAPIRGQHYWRVGPQAALRAGDWKIHRGRGDRTWQLYDLASDIGEERDVRAANPEKFAELEKAWETLNREMVEPLWSQGGGGGRRTKQ